jgi:hypothetical protein
MHKLSHLVGNEWIEHSFAPVYTLENERITGGVPGGDASIFETLVTCLSEPIFVLYILHTPRGEANPGRYQSPELTMKEFRTFIGKYREFLARDARFDIWAHSPDDHATIVWDRHNNFFAYGPLQKFVSQLRALGFDEGTIQPLGAHQHHYREELDSLAMALIGEYKWSYSPLRPEDEQLARAR